MLLADPADPVDPPGPSDEREDGSFLRPNESASFVTASRIPAIGDVADVLPSAGTGALLAR